jgi:diguanylate cyclase (GGDEF)-like protein
MVVGQPFLRRTAARRVATARQGGKARIVGLVMALLRGLGWGTPVLSLTVLWASGGKGTEAVPPLVRVAGLMIVFGSLIARVALTAWLAPGRRVALGALAAGLVLWVSGSAVLNSAPAPAQVTFPAPGEWLFLSAYVGFTAWLVLDRAGASRSASGGWLEAVIVYGGTTCLASFLLISPVARRFAGRDVSLLAAFVYVLLDVVMLLLVVGQTVLRQRTDVRSSVRLVTSLLLLTFADTDLVVSASAGTYTYGELLELAWCIGFLLLGDAACVPAGPAGASSGERSREPRPSSMPVVGAATVALAALTVLPPAGMRPYVVVPALVTLVATGLRLVLALRESRVMNEALRLSRTDDLTGLPNRRALNDHLSDALERSGPFGLLLLDLDGFKEVNDTLGHAAGDSVLQAIAGRVAAAGRPGAFAVRLGGDEFAFAVDEGDPVELLAYAAQIQDVVRKPVRVEGLDVTLAASIGVAVRTDATRRPGDLLRQADIAMYQAKASRVGSLLYDAERDQFTRERLRIAEDLRSGIERGQIQAWYQPKVEAASGRPYGVEALIRWWHPTDGLVSPGVFLPIARRAGLMPALTTTMIRQVIEDLSAWRATGLEIQVAINIAPTELLAPGVVADLFAQIHAAQVPPGRLVVEVTEDTFLTDPDRARMVIEQIRAEGVEVSIDDYGTGFSSLAYLRDLPVQELKIDRSFVADLLTEPRDGMIVSTTSALAKGLGLRTVAEGVEDAATAAELRRIGIDVLQGFHFARPMPAREIPGWFTQRALATLPRVSAPSQRLRDAAQ